MKLIRASVVLRASVVMMVVFAVVVGSAQTSASTVTLHFDPAETTINWTLADVLHTVRGTFKLSSGTVTFDEATGAAGGELVVETASGESGNNTRDRRMKADVLQSTAYPEAIFHPKKITGMIREGQTQTITVEGIFSVHGADHPLTLHVQVSEAGRMLTAKTSFAVPYVAWGMKDPSTFVLRVGKEVNLDIDAKATLQ